MRLKLKLVFEMLSEQPKARCIAKEEAMIQAAVLNKAMKQIDVKVLSCALR